ncbi:mitogen-activated protein kinase kinase kinase 5-like isoform X2 [Tripterygium wilfordii]|uniref:mitogen-activated protein kinase kinase kinase 5-like isoform X2 n=1 Tax=Tripterygium wilfordii TaxID=458696 RepID=UPI0018F8646A|nr:mitogen-activated protein kinase kinase kinase 5-like isoform X2 [Tripterygium wilfordii]
MRLFKKYSCSSSSSYPSSPSSPSVTGNDGNSANYHGRSFTQRRLTRQRKLRHVSENELGLQSRDSSRSLPSSPDSNNPKPRLLGGSDHWSLFAVPQPLPLPDLSRIRRPDLNLGSGLIGSPEARYCSAMGRNDAYHVATTPGKSPCNFCGKVSEDANDESVRFPAKTAPATAVSSPAVSPRSGDASPSFLDRNLAKPTGTYRKRFSQDLDDLIINNNPKSNVFSGSAPTSVLSSPLVSPQRSNSIDFLPSYLAPQGCQVRSASEVPKYGRLASHTSPVTAVKTMQSPDHSPLSSSKAQSPRLSLNSPSKFIFPFHHNLFPGSSKERPESNNHVNAHPLPLPPGAMAPSQSVMPLPPAVTHHTTEKANLSSSKIQWQKGKLIGRGTFGSVYAAIDRDTGASCAMKEVDIIPDDPKSAECIKQLEQEIRILRQLKHPNIVQYYGSEIVDDHLYIYLEYIHPGSINKYVRDHCGSITESIVRNFTRHILSGLAYLHSSKTIHRDIKCANLLVDPSGTVKLADFGMAKHLTGLSYELSLKGSPYWMAPEVLKAVMLSDASPDLALAVDIWSLGCTVIEMFTGRPPWSELEGPQAMFKVLNKTPPIPETLSSEGKDFLNWCFRRNPADRPSAIKLLEHPFVQNSKDHNVSFCRQVPAEKILMNKSSNSGECSPRKTDVMPPPQQTRIKGQSFPSNSLPTSGVASTPPTEGALQSALCSGVVYRTNDTCQQGFARPLNCATTSHSSPRPALENSHSLSMLQVHGSHNFSPSNVSSISPLGSGNNHPCALSRTHEVPHI